MKRDTKLLIVESPAKIKTISKFLGTDFKIMATFGHIKDLPSKNLGIEMDRKKGTLDFEYVVIEDKQQKINDICRAAKTADEVYLASDPDREGEIIAWHIGKEIEKVLKKSSKIYRITFNEITKSAVNEAIEHKATIDMQKVAAQQARRALDRWVGYEVSPILWRKIKKGLSAGRVQSAALLIVVIREDEILNFKTEESWSIHGTFKNGKAEVVAELVKIGSKKAQLKNKQEADVVLVEIKKESYAVTDITVKKRLKNPLPPFMTSTLQQDAFNKLGFSVEKTMSVAQKLYEGVSLGSSDNMQALITYMRTDSLRLSDTALQAARRFIEKNYGDDYLPKSANFYAKKAAQDAHEAIRPIDVAITPEMVSRYLTKEQASLYSLIWKRFVACQMTPAEYQQRQVTIEGGKFEFRLTGSTLMFDGFLKVYEVEEEDDEQSVKIPKEIKKDLPLTLTKLDPKQHFTQPPPRYSEASLVKEMEKQGIGRPSTYAATLATLHQRGYVTKDKKRFQPTELGRSVSNMLSQNLPDIINLKFTAKMEEDLDKIATGAADRDKVLFSFYKKFEKDLETFAGEAKKGIETDLKCPECRKKLIIRFGKAGEFVGCSGFPECTFTSNFARNPDGSLKLVAAEKPQVSDIKCPNCGKNLVQRVGKFGPFLSCPGYPECKYIHQETLKMPCPLCKGKIVQRASKRGKFWGCANYPKCNFVIFGDVEETPCPKCKSPYLLVTRSKAGSALTCPNKTCGYKKEI